MAPILSICRKLLRVYPVRWTTKTVSAAPNLVRSSHKEVPALIVPLFRFLTTSPALVALFDKATSLLAMIFDLKKFQPQVQ
jgi:hypothetical protein